MKAVLAVVAVVLLVCGELGQAKALGANAEPPKPSKNESLGLHLPVPPYPEEARQQRITGSGICLVAFGASGRVAKAVMTKSTGSKILDGSAVQFAVKHWTGPANQRANVPVVYNLDQRSSLPPAGSVNRGLCRATFNMLGYASSVVIIKSCGSAILDKNTVDYGRAHWYGPPNTTQIVPVVYVTTKNP